MEFAFSLVQVNRFHAYRKNISCFSYERGDNFQVKMVEVQLEMSFLGRGEFELRGFLAEAPFKKEPRFKTVIVVLGQAFGAQLYLRIAYFRNGFSKRSL